MGKILNDGASKQFSVLAETVNPMLALFYICAANNIPFYLKKAQELDKVTIMGYINKLLQNKIELGKNGETFEDGETDIEALVDFLATGEDRWQRDWGTGYTPEEYKRLDEIFDTYSARLVSAGGYDVQQEDTLRVCAKMRLKADQALSLGTKEGVDIAAKLNKMIQDNLASENLRKRDEKPVEELRIDSIVDSLEKAGFLKKGKILPLADVQRVLLERAGQLGGKPSHVYPYTLDAADQMLQAIINTMRVNDGQPIITQLPDNMRLDANVASEFAEKPNADEIEAYSKMGLVRRGQEPKPQAKKPQNHQKPQNPPRQEQQQRKSPPPINPPRPYWPERYTPKNNPPRKP